MIIESSGNQRCALEGTNIEAFTRKPFSELISESHSKGQDYYLTRLICNEPTDDHQQPKRQFFCYDARQLCKFIFEMVISEEGKAVHIKNFKDPVNQKTIQEMYFFRLRHDSETPLRAEYAGNQQDFLDSHSFRSKLFNNEDLLDALSVNFKSPKTMKLPLISRKHIFLILFVIALIILVSTVGLYISEHRIARKLDPSGIAIDFKPKGGAFKID